MASNQDILQCDQEAQIKEKEKEKQARDNERQEDMQNDQMWCQREVLSAMQPAEDRLAQQGKVIGELSRQLYNII